MIGFLLIVGGLLGAALGIVAWGRLVDRWILRRLNWHWGDFV